jgi:Fe-S cluster assembly ATPase SufC
MICGDESGLRDPQYSTMMDELTLLPGCFLVPKEQTLAQRALYRGTPEKRYLAVVGGLIVEKDAAGRATVDLLIAGENAYAAHLQAVITEPPCTATLEQVDSVLDVDAKQVQTSIDALNNQATARVALTSFKTHVYTLLGKLYKCVLVRTGGVQ